jgi:hypothetical protein
MPRMTALHMLRSTITTVSAPASSSFRGSITHPTQPYFRFFLSLFFSTRPNEFFQIQAYLITGFDCWLCYFCYSILLLQLWSPSPGSGGQPIALQAIARDIARRMIDIFLLDKNQRRPVYGGAPKFADDTNWRDHLLFYEYFHGDNGAGIGASHHTGWTALVANLIDEWH